MSKVKHTETPWYFDDDTVVDVDDNVIAILFSGNNEVDARRIAACVNACKDIDTEYLEQGIVPYFMHLIAELVEQRDELLADLPAPKHDDPIFKAHTSGLSTALLLVEEVVTKAKSGEA